MSRSCANSFPTTKSRPHPKILGVFSRLICSGWNKSFASAKAARAGGCWSSIAPWNPAAPPLFGLLTGNIREGARIKLQHYNLWKNFPSAPLRTMMRTATASPPSPGNVAANASAAPCAATKSWSLATRRWTSVAPAPSRPKRWPWPLGSFTVEELLTHAPDWAVPDLSKIPVQELMGGD